MLHALARPLCLIALALPALAIAQTPSTLDKIKQSGSMSLAYRESSIPFSYLGSEAGPVGFAYEICEKIADNVKKATGRSDMQVAFATNYFYTGTRFLVKSGTKVDKLGDLAGKQVVSTTGTTNFQIIRRLNEDQKLGIDLLGAKDHAESALMVQTGRAVAFGMDDILLYGLRASSQNPAELSVVGEPIQVEPYAIMVRKDDPAFKKLVDDTLAAMMKSGEFETLYEKWFQAPIPPKGINLNAPMSKELIDNMKALSDKPAT